MYVTLSVRAAKNLHKALLISILKCSMQFFESTPVGRILNRFAKDIEIIESKIPDAFRISVRQSFLVLSALAVISINTPYFMIGLIPIFALYFFVQVTKFTFINSSFYSYVFPKKFI